MDICKKLGITKTTFYRYIDSKEDSDDCVSDTYLNSERHINLIKALSVVGYVVFSVVLPYSSVIIFLNINTHSGTLMFVAVEYLILN